MKNSPQHPPPPGFSLIEMMAAIAVIFILAAIVIAGIGKVRERANTATCAANLRSIHSGLSLFIQENNNRMPELWNQQPPYTRIPNFNEEQEPVGTRNLSFILDRKFGIDPKIFVCPEGADDPDITNFYRTPFSTWNKDGGVFHLFGRSPFDTEDTAPRTMHFLLSEAAASPSNLIILYDSVVPGNPAFRQEPPHNGKMNMLFLDGSVRTLAREDAPEGNRDFN